MEALEPMGDGQKLTPQQLDAIEWILSGCTDQETGDLVQADRTTERLVQSIRQAYGQHVLSYVKPGPRQRLSQR